MNMTVPESRNNGLAGTINHTRISGNRNIVAAADRADDATGDDNDRIGKRRGIRRCIDAAPQQHERLRACRRATASISPEQKKRDTKPIPDHGRIL
jgi:hypothetical protein